MRLSAVELAGFCRRSSEHNADSLLYPLQSAQVRLPAELDGIKGINLAVTLEIDRLKPPPRALGIQTVDIVGVRVRPDFHQKEMIHICKVIVAHHGQLGHFLGQQPLPPQFLVGSKGAIPRG